MHDQVRVAADGRGEVRVGLGREAEVPDVLGRVPRLFHGAEQDGVDQRLFGRALGLGQGLLQVQGLELLHRRQA